MYCNVAAIRSVLKPTLNALALNALTLLHGDMLLSSLSFAKYVQVSFVVVHMFNGYDYL